MNRWSRKTAVEQQTIMLMALSLYVDADSKAFQPRCAARWTGCLERAYDLHGKGQEWLAELERKDDLRTG